MASMGSVGEVVDHVLLKICVALRVVGLGGGPMAHQINPNDFSVGVGQKVEPGVVTPGPSGRAGQSVQQCDCGSAHSAQTTYGWEAISEAPEKSRRPRVTSRPKPVDFSGPSHSVSVPRLACAPRFPGPYPPDPHGT